MAKSLWGSISAAFIKPDEEPEIPLDVEVEESKDIPPVPTGYTVTEILGSSDIVEGRPFEDIYRAANVPASPYSVEKLLGFTAGLSGMSEAQVRSVVAALDASDNTWTIEDPVEDAKNKIEALRAEKVRFSDTASGVEAASKAEAVALDEQLTATSANIKQQIEALQASLHEAIDLTSKGKSDADAKARSVREAANREASRLDIEISRLSRVPATFGTGPIGK